MKLTRYLIALVIGIMITSAPASAQEKRLPTLFIIGDSTVKNCPLTAFLLRRQIVVSAFLCAASASLR